MPTSQALERAPGASEVAVELGIVRQSKDGSQFLIDFTDPALQEKYNVLVPAAIVARANPFFAPAPSAMRLTKAECYPLEFEGSGNSRRAVAWGLPKQHIEKLASLSGISACRREQSEKDGVLTIVVWAHRLKLDGTWEEQFGTREWRVADEEQLMRSKVPDYVLKDGPADTSNATYNRWWNKEWLDGKKKHSLANTETKARLRAFRALLTVKSKYTAAELDKQFLVCPILMSPDMTIPGMREAVIAQGIRAMGSLFGTSEASALPPGGHQEYKQLAPAEDLIQDDALEDALACDPEDLPPHDKVTGEVLEGQATEESTESAPQAESTSPETETHGERPQEDWIIPQGVHKGKPMSLVAKEDPAYVTKTFIKSKNVAWGLHAEAWRFFWHGEAGSYDDITF